MGHTKNTTTTYIFGVGPPGLKGPVRLPSSHPPKGRAWIQRRARMVELDEEGAIGHALQRQQEERKRWSLTRRASAAEQHRAAFAAGLDSKGARGGGSSRQQVRSGGGGQYI
jgi:hypothetical protein